MAKHNKKQHKELCEDAISPTIAGKRLSEIMDADENNKVVR